LHLFSVNKLDLYAYGIVFLAGLYGIVPDCVKTVTL